jgi:haloacetate dehalogenase
MMTRDQLPIAESSVLPGLRGFRSQTVDLDEVRLHYVLGGDGPTLVLLHGWAQCWWAWERLMPALARRFTVVAPDLRGVGGSSVPPDGYDKRTMAGDVRGLVEHLGSSEICMVGHDIGGMVAYAYAAQFPETVRAAAIAAVLVPEPSWRDLPLLPSGPTWNWWWAFHSVDRIADKLIGDNLEYYLNAFFDLQRPGLNQDTRSITAADRQRFVAAYASPGSLSAGLSWFRAFGQDIDDNEKWLAKQLQVPWLALGDPAAIAAMAEQGRRISSNSRAVEISPSGHWVLQQQPTQVLDTLTPFLSADHRLHPCP